LVETQRVERIKKAVQDSMRRKDMLISREGNLVTLINVFETTPEKQQALIDQWVRFTEEVRNEPGYLGTALHKSTDGTRVINYAHWRSQADFDAYLRRH
jgi:quinol monooxygenase YgiN